MPELPEVETTVFDLRKKVLGRAFIDVWTNFPKLVSRPTSFLDFKEQIKGKKIQKIRRKGKNIIFDLSRGFSLLVHQKMTGHLLYGKWKQKGGQWLSQTAGPLRDDPQNRFLHLIFWLDNGYQLALSDLRKFARVEFQLTTDLQNSKAIKDLGPDALSKSLTFEEFKQRIKKRRTKIKQVLMNQTVIAGIGNIYSDEILFWAEINPVAAANKLNSTELKKIYEAMGEVLRKAIKVKGSSVTDYRTPSGEKGRFDELRKVYRRAGEKCSRCGSTIKRMKISGRSAHYCSKCQKLKIKVKINNQ